MSPIIAQQSSVYNWNIKDNTWHLAGTAAFFGGSTYLIASTDAPTEFEINALDRNDVLAFDRAALDNFSNSNLKIASDVFLFSSITLPFLHYINSKGRDEGLAMAGLTLQAFFVSDGITNYFKGSVKRLRPFTYNPTIPLEEKLKRDAQFSFISGHTSNTALFSFLAAKFYNDLYPHSRFKKVVWVTAATIPAVTGYLRYSIGKHFPTDIIGGYIVGATVGVLLPHLYKRKMNDTVLNLVPVQNGLVLSVRKTIK